MDATMVWKQRFSNWACGALTLLVGLTASGALLTAYRALECYAPLRWPANPVLSFGLAFVAIDLLYYLQHRAEHRSKLLWALHAVHHQSNLCDTSVSLRSSALAPLTVLVLHLPLAFSGLPFAVYFPAYLLHVGLIFLLHSRTPRWLDRAGWVFNSPYLHRAHHSNHPKLRGKNFGGVFIVWDRLFGTFEADCDEATAFGIGRQPTPLNPLAANLAPFKAWYDRRA
ncbi:MAG: sterol desaturase family protein [Archangium sp.]|nr:sterol desaturase family protein [Archangium sp.]